MGKTERRQSGQAALDPHFPMFTPFFVFTTECCLTPRGCCYCTWWCVSAALFKAKPRMEKTGLVGQVGPQNSDRASFCTMGSGKNGHPHFSRQNLFVSLWLKTSMGKRENEGLRQTHLLDQSGLRNTRKLTILYNIMSSPQNINTAQYSLMHQHG